MDRGKLWGRTEKKPQETVLERHLSMRWLNLGGCEASVLNQKELEVCGQLVSLTPTTSVSQAASHGLKGKVIADSLLR